MARKWGNALGGYKTQNRKGGKFASGFAGKSISGSAKLTKANSTPAQRRAQYLEGKRKEAQKIKRKQTTKKVVKTAAVVGAVGVGAYAVSRSGVGRRAVTNAMVATMSPSEGFGRTHARTTTKRPASLRQKALAVGVVSSTAASVARDVRSLKPTERYEKRSAAVKRAAGDRSQAKVVASINAQSRKPYGTNGVSPLGAALANPLARPSSGRIPEGRPMNDRVREKEAKERLAGGGVHTFANDVGEPSTSFAGGDPLEGRNPVAQRGRVTRETDNPLALHLSARGVWADTFGDPAAKDTPKKASGVVRAVNIPAADTHAVRYEERKSIGHEGYLEPMLGQFLSMQKNEVAGYVPKKADSITPEQAKAKMGSVGGGNKKARQVYHPVHEPNTQANRENVRYGTIPNAANMKAAKDQVSNWNARLAAEGLGEDSGKPLYGFYNDEAGKHGSADDFVKSFGTNQDEFDAHKANNKASSFAPRQTAPKRSTPVVRQLTEDQLSVSQYRARRGRDAQAWKNVRASQSNALAGLQIKTGFEENMKGKRRTAKGRR